MAGTGSRTLFIFRRDLRLDDNAGLGAALARGAPTIAAFILDPRQAPGRGYFSGNGFGFMLERLAELGRELESSGGRLFVFRGQPHEVAERLIGELRVRAVYVNEDYTPFSRERDLGIERVCDRLGVEFFSVHDALLNPPHSVLKADGDPYTVFTHYYNKASRLPVGKPSPPPEARYYRGRIGFAMGKAEFRALVESASNPDRRPGGRSRGLKLLDGLGALADYDRERNIPALEATSGLSPYHKFGAVSVRETFHAAAAALGSGHPLLRQLYWRDFFTAVGFHFPRVFGRPFQPRFHALEWEENESGFEAWRTGRTGFPLVDAGMRQLALTGSMHNRARMVAASFLTKDLHVDWRRGERHFAGLLTDYDPAVNNGNWQWAASTGCDAQPWFRIFNPWLQQKKFDPGCEYIKRWVPELEGLDARTIHDWSRTGPLAGIDYPAPILDHREQSARARARYKRTAPN